MSQKRIDTSHIARVISANIKSFLTIFLACTITIGLSQETTKVESFRKALNSADSDSLKIHYLNELSWELRHSNIKEATEYARLAVVLSQKNNLKKSEATSYNRLGEIAKIQNYLNLADSLFTKALLTEQEINHTFGIARAKSQLSIIQKNMGNLSNARLLSEESIAIFKDLNLPNASANVLVTLSDIYRHQGLYSKAVLAIEECITIAKKSNSRTRLAHALNSLASIQMEMSLYAQAKENLKKSLDIWLNRYNYLEQSKVLTNMAVLSMYVGDYPMAKEQNLRSLFLKDSLGLQNRMTVNYNNLGIIFKKEGKLAKAREYYELDESLKKQIGDSIGIIGSLNNLGNLLYEQGEIETALSKYLEGIVYAKDRNNHVHLLELYKGAADSYLSLGNLNKGIEYNELYLKIRDSIDTNYKEFINTSISLNEERSKALILARDNELVIQKNKRKNWIIFSLTITLFLFSLLMYSFVKSNSLKHKNTKMKSVVDDLLKDQEIKAMTAMINGQEDERKRIAQDLHDRLGGLLSMVKLHFKGVEENLKKFKEQNKSQYELANKLLDEACEEVRKVAHDMASGILNRFGLIKALTSLSSSVNGAGQLKLEIINFGFGTERLDYKVEINIYRIIQELLSNTLKHSGASEMTIQLVKSEKSLNIVVEDNGSGFIVDSVQATQGMGLRNINNRVIQLNGAMNIDSGKGGGTTITIDIPIINKEK